MKIAIDITPIKGDNSGHKVRGSGSYISHLKESLVKYFPQHSYMFFTKRDGLDPTADIIHYPYFDPFFLSLPIKCNIQSVVTVHDVIPLLFSDKFPIGIKGAIKWFLQKYALSKKQAIITDSECSRTDILHYIPISEEKVHVVYLAAGEQFKKVVDNSSNNKKLEKVKKKYNLPSKFALYVGDCTWNKNVPNLIKAIKKKQIPLVLVGSAFVKSPEVNKWNEDLIEVLEMIKNNPLVTALGYVPDEDLVLLYNVATLLVVPSRYEGFGLPVLEAMSSGCPVVTAKKGSLPEVAGDASLYVNPDDVEDIARGIKEVYDDADLRENLIQKGYRQNKLFTWKKTAQETIRIYEKTYS